MDQKSSEGKHLGFYLVSEDGTSIPLEENRIGRSTHYQVTLNLRDLGPILHASKVVKLRAEWKGFDGLLPEAVVQRWQPSRRTERIDIGRTSYMPPKVGPGDRNFGTQDDEHMSIRCEAQIKLNGTSIIESRVHLRAKEERSDWTEVAGWSNWAAAYNAPSGWNILTFRPNQNAVHDANITTHGMHSYSRPGGECVSRFEVWGDRGGDEAGTWTKIEAHWRPLEVEIEESTPNWLR